MLTIRPTVFVVDHDPTVRTSLAAIARGAAWNFQTYESANVLLARAPLMVEGCVILDIDPPGVAGLDVLARLAAERRETPIIAIADYGDIPTTVRVMKAGAAEFLVKPLIEQTLFPAIQSAMSRSRAILDETSALRDVRTRYESLSGRERQVMMRVVAGELNKRIGSALGISEITVKAHRGKVMRKMAADSLAELVIMSLKLDLHAVASTTPSGLRLSSGGYHTTRVAHFDAGPRLLAAGTR